MLFNMLVHRIHSRLFLPDLHLRINLVNFILADKISDRGSDPQNFLTKYAAFRNTRKELLSNYALENE